MPVYWNIQNLGTGSCSSFANIIKCRNDNTFFIKLFPIASGRHMSLIALERNILDMSVFSDLESGYLFQETHQNLPPTKHPS